MLGRQNKVVVMEPREGEPTVQRFGKTKNAMKEDREMKIVCRREHFNSSGGGRHRREELGGRIHVFWMNRVGEHWRIDGWVQIPVGEGEPWLLLAMFGHTSIYPLLLVN
jgi:hypothetical protein